MITTKDLREMCQNGVTLDDVRRLYGVNATLEDLELVMPSRLIGNLGILPCSKVATESLFDSQEESQDGEEEEVSTSQDEAEEEVSTSREEASEDKVSTNQGTRKEEMNSSEEARGEEMSTSQDEVEEEMSPSQMEKREGALALLSSTGQQATREIEPEAPSFYNPPQCTIPWHPLFALCLSPQTSNILDVLTSLEILSQLR